ncbi:hypothetical protein HDU86_006311 [Geranomyces michiganensis]|nr:hypothetical protein HDU86_006311 [Geranomyces michiganensis]
MANAPGEEQGFDGAASAGRRRPSREDTDRPEPRAVARRGRNFNTTACDKVVTGQKLDMRVTLCDTQEKLEAMICLRSGGLPKPPKNKAECDRADLLNCLMEILLAYMRKVDGVLADQITKMFVIGMQSHG